MYKHGFLNSLSPSLSLSLFVLQTFISFFSSDFGFKKLYINNWNKWKSIEINKPNRREKKRELFEGQTQKERMRERERDGREVGCEEDNVILRNKEYFIKYINVLTKAQIYKCCKGVGKFLENCMFIHVLI